MCESIERRYKRERITGAIQFLKKRMEMPDDYIIENVTDEFNVTKEYVLELLTPESV